MSDDIHADARERYERAREALIRRGWMTRAEAEREIFGQATRPIYFSPLRNSLVIREGFEAEKRAAEARGRREWIDGVRRRLGLVAEVHRCRVYGGNEGRPWAWMCQRPDCDGSDCEYYPSQPAALAAALAHARTFVPKPVEDEPLTELQWALCMALYEDAARQRQADEAAFSDRVTAVAGQINDALAGVLPDGLRFEWTPYGE